VPNLPTKYLKKILSGGGGGGGLRNPSIPPLKDSPESTVRQECQIMI